jgi:DNA (cytosine-5)-methyltransferase 1
MKNNHQQQQSMVQRSSGHRRNSAPAIAAKHRHLPSYSFIDLFAGVGGFHLALEGLAQCVMASEWNEQARITYALNFGKDLGQRRVPFVADINGVDRQAIPDHTILCGGFPCQPFSLAGSQIGFAHEQGNLFFSIAEILYAKRPRVVFLENVKNLVGHDGGKTFGVIRKRLDALGYLLKYQVLDGAEHGNVPQHRERVFLVAFREQADFDQFAFPSKIELDRQRLPELINTSMRRAPEFYLTDSPTRFAKVMRETAKEQGVFYRWWRRRLRQHKRGVCPTLVADGGDTIPVIRDDYGIRRLTPRECFALQGFPQDFILPELANCHLYKQAGNSIVVPVVRRVGRKIVEALAKTDSRGMPG